MIKLNFKLNKNFLKLFFFFFLVVLNIYFFLPWQLGEYPSSKNPTSQEQDGGESLLEPLHWKQVFSSQNSQGWKHSFFFLNFWKNRIYFFLSL
jgi:hypothetical protein